MAASPPSTPSPPKNHKNLCHSERSEESNSFLSDSNALNSVTIIPTNFKILKTCQHNALRVFDFCYFYLFFLNKFLIYCLIGTAYLLTSL